MSLASALVHAIPFPTPTFVDRRATVRRLCGGEAVSRSLDSPATLCWGAQVRDISAGGIGLVLCFPFKPGTCLAIDLAGPEGAPRTVLARVVHVHDQTDGTWVLGCEFVRPLRETAGV